MLWQKEMLQLKYTFYIYAFDIGEMITSCSAEICQTPDNEEIKLPSKKHKA